MYIIISGINRVSYQLGENFIAQGNEVTFIEIEDFFFAKRIKLFFKKKNIIFNEINSPMFLTSRDEFKKYLKGTKKPFMANFYKINRSKLDILMNKDGLEFARIIGSINFNEKKFVDWLAKYN